LLSPEQTVCCIIDLFFPNQQYFFAQGASIMKKLSRRCKTILISICIGLAVIAVILFCRNFRYYSAEIASKIFEECGLHSVSTGSTSPGAIITHLHSSDFKKCSSDSTRAEVYDLFGQPHARCGSGLVKDVYFTTDGYLVFILYINNACIVQQIGTLKL